MKVFVNFTFDSLKAFPRSHKTSILMFYYHVMPCTAHQYIH